MWTGRVMVDGHSFRILYLFLLHDRPRYTHREALIPFSTMQSTVRVDNYKALSASSFSNDRGLHALQEA